MIEGLPVHGYVAQPKAAIDLVNTNKIDEEHILRTLDAMVNAGAQYDQRWIAIARTHFDQAWMALNRAVFRPQRIKLSRAMLPEPLTWYQVTAPHFCAGLGVAPDGRVAGAAPIIAWMRGKPLAGIESYCARKGWRMVRLERQERLMSRTILKCSIVEQEEGHMTVHLATRDPHLESCPSCLAAYGLRIANAFHLACEQAARNRDDDDEPDTHHALH